MAAFQVCLQVWLTTSLLADGLVVACQLSVILGLVPAAILGTGLYFEPQLFIKDANVIQLIRVGIPVTIAVLSILFLLVLSHFLGVFGIWIALSMFMSLRALAGLLRIGTGSGPWQFLRG